MDSRVGQTITDVLYEMQLPNNTEELEKPSTTEPSTSISSENDIKPNICKMDVGNEPRKRYLEQNGLPKCKH